MKCRKFRRLIPDFLEGQLTPKRHEEIIAHLKICKDCAKEKRLYEESWQLIGQWQDIEPEPGFKMRFWNHLLREAESKLAPPINIFRLSQRWSVALATAAIIIIVVSISLPNYLQTKSAELFVSEINEEEIILVENIELLEHLEIIQDIDFLENMELIENLDKFELDKV